MKFYQVVKIQIVRNVPNHSQWFWRLVAQNGKTLATSECYSSFGQAKKTAGRLALRISSCGLEVVDGGVKKEIR